MYGGVESFWLNVFFLVPGGRNEEARDVLSLFFPPLFRRTWGAGFAYFTAQQEIMNTEYCFYFFCDL